MDVALNIVGRHAGQTRAVMCHLPATVGRDERADVCIHDPWASHTHCVLSENNGLLSLRDLGSKNGVFLHGRRVTQADLLPGDCFTIGETKITVQYQRMVPSDTPPAEPAQATAQPPSPNTPAGSGPETRDLLYGAAEETAPHDAAPKQAGP